MEGQIQPDEEEEDDDDDGDEEKKGDATPISLSIDSEDDIKSSQSGTDPDLGSDIDMDTDGTEDDDFDTSAFSKSVDAEVHHRILRFQPTLLMIVLTYRQ